MSEDVLVRNLEHREPGPFIEAPANACLPDLQYALAEGVVVPVSALEGAVDEEPQQVQCVLLRGFTPVLWTVLSQSSITSTWAVFRRLAWGTNSNGSIEKSGQHPVPEHQQAHRGNGQLGPARFLVQDRVKVCRVRGIEDGSVRA